MSLWGDLPNKSILMSDPTDEVIDNIFLEQAKSFNDPYTVKIKVLKFPNLFPRYISGLGKCQGCRLCHPDEIKTPRFDYNAQIQDGIILRQVFIRQLKSKFTNIKINFYASHSRLPKESPNQ